MKKYNNPNRKHSNPPEMRITNVPDTIKEKIENIAANEGNTLAAFMRPHLRKIIELYPDWMHKPPVAD